MTTSRGRYQISRLIRERRFDIFYVSNVSRLMRIDLSSGRTKTCLRSITSDRDNRVSTAKLKIYFRNMVISERLSGSKRWSCARTPGLINVKLETFVWRNPPRSFGLDDGGAGSKRLIFEGGNRQLVTRVFTSRMQMRAPST